MSEPNLKLQLARKQRSWSQEEAAAAVNVDRKTYIRWEKGQCFPQPKLLDAACKAFGLSAAELGFDSAFENAVVDSQARIPTAQGGLPRTSNSRLALLQEIIDRNFARSVTEDFLSSNVKTMNFRDEWQFIVNNLVAEEKICLRAMVFDVELTRWWNSIPGKLYMMTNIDLLKRRIPVKRVFILSSIDARLRMNTLINAYVHSSLGIDVKVCHLPNFQEGIPFKPDMFSVHDNLYVTLYYFSREKPIANLLLDQSHIAEFTSFYDEVFADDRLCMDIKTALAKYHCSESFWASVRMQQEMLKTLEKVHSVTDLARRT